MILPMFLWSALGPALVKLLRPCGITPLPVDEDWLELLCRLLRVPLPALDESALDVLIAELR